MQRAKAEGSVSPPRAGDDGKRGWERTTHDRGQVRPPDPGWQRAGDSSVKITSAGDCSTPRPPPRAAMLTLLSVMGQKNIHHVDCTDDWKNQLLLVQNHLKNSPEELTAVLQALLREDELRTRNLPPRDVFQEPSDQGHAEIAPPVDKALATGILLSVFTKLTAPGTIWTWCSACLCESDCEWASEKKPRDCLNFHSSSELLQEDLQGANMHGAAIPCGNHAFFWKPPA
nr:uncharacterized protein LOC103349679 isoform X1 [Oryctolagus cuniculus]